MTRTASTVGTALLIGATAMQMCNGLAMTRNSRVTTAAAAAASISGSQEPVETYEGLSRELIYQNMKARYAESRYYDKIEIFDDNEDEMDENDPNFFAFDVNSFQELQRSTGSEILDDKLQLQIDEATDHPDRFLDAHVDDATLMEKVAMSSVPEQLPKPAVDALSQSNNAKKKSSTTKTDKATAAIDGENKKKPFRVTPQQEIELGKMIQKGVELFSLKSEYEEANDRKLDRQEWAELAGLDSAKKLRRAVADYRKAKQLLVSANMGLVHAVVNGLYYKSRANYNNKKYNGIPYDELVQEGSLGLIRAAELFDPSRGLRFSTYATIWIKGALSNSHIAETVTLPQREKAKFNKISSATLALEQTDEEGKKPTMERLAEHLGMDVAEVTKTSKRMNQLRKVLSLDYEYNVQSRSGMQSGSMNTIVNDKAFQADADLAERTQLRADIVAALASNLDAREARLMRLRYGLVDGQTRTIRECAEAMGLSQGRTNVIARNCLNKLREAAEAESLQEYLLTIA